MSWLAAFVLTLALEVPVYALALRSRLGAVGGIAFALAINSLSHPIAWRLTAAASWRWFIGVELAVWAAEATAAWLLCRARGRPLRVADAAALALSANALSAGAGLLLA